MKSYLVRLMNLRSIIERSLSEVPSAKERRVIPAVELLADLAHRTRMGEKFNYGPPCTICDPKTAFKTTYVKQGIRADRNSRGGPIGRIEGAIGIDDIIHALKAPQTMMPDVLAGAIAVGNWDHETTEAFTKFLKNHVEVFPLSLLASDWYDLAWQNLIKPGQDTLPTMNYHDSPSIRKIRNLVQFNPIPRRNLFKARAATFQREQGRFVSIFLSRSANFMHMTEKWKIKGKIMIKREKLTDYILQLH